MLREITGLRKILAAIAGLLVFLPTASAYSHAYGSVTQFLNTYFLPSSAQVTGLSGLIFGVLLPFGIVLILLYIGLSRVLRDREAVALAVLISLFIIPSGGYRVISTIFLALFGLGNLSPGAPGAPTLPGNIQQNIPLIWSFIVVVGLTSAFHFTKENFGIWEYFVVVGAGIMAYFIAGGNLAVVWTMVGYGILFFIGLEIFNRGMGSNRISGNIIGLIGILVIALSVSTLTVLPAPVRGIAGTLAGVGFAAIIFLILFLIAAVVIIGYMVWNGIPPFN